MPSLLSRIEFEYVMKIFTETKPVLCLAYKDLMQELKTSEYSVNGLHITANKKLSILNNEKIIVSFFHKKRKMYFETSIKNSGGFICFSVPDKIFKSWQNNKKLNMPNIQVFYGGNVIFQAAAPPMFFRKEKTEKDSKPCLTAKEIIKTMTELIPDKDSLYVQKKKLLFFLEIKKNGKQTFSQALLFSDSEFILLFCEKNFALNAEREELKVRFNFSNRIINCTAKYNFFYPSVNSETGFLSLKITEAAEEDKRFLHEQIRRTKYGQ